MTTTKSKPTAEQIDELCNRFDKAKIAVEQAEQKLSGVKGELLAAVQDFGYVPTNAEKTTRLEGALYVADATVASTVAISETAVGELQSELSRFKLPRVFSKLFARKVTHTLQKDAHGALELAIGGFPLEAKKRLLSLFASCFKVDSKTPALTVTLVAALRAKEAAATEKAAKKAARAAKKKRA
jgi:hypothetical protein